ncbi:MAG: PaaI family thioesterase [Paraburkholderia sp.]|uniref:PaaI family thioesterase n=1 Tax=Paraburkholderia sp. TaxID=1926495 RepID=UPI0011F76EE2|nr:PaaI family thioesterase [Paraburkholderia sp.]TAL99728.1 MAG: PaaI family thioesterase [Paraburkholderia sp.]TAM30837.1 MAG: PaaI family thioesterase [Paraburkholderia sp.]
MNLVAELPPGLTGLEQLQHMIQHGGRAPIGDTLDFHLVEVEAGRVVFEGTPGLHAYNPIGTVHGGYAATLLDSACGCAGHSRLGAAQGYTTLELKVSYHRAMTVDTGPVRAEGRVITIGRRAAFTEATITDKAGKVYATATSTLLVFER